MISGDCRGVERVNKNPSARFAARALVELLKFISRGEVRIRRRRSREQRRLCEETTALVRDMFYAIHAGPVRRVVVAAA